MSFKRPHLLISDFPLKEGQDYQSLCKKPISKAAWIFMWDVDGMGTYELSLGAICHKCCTALNEHAPRYIYGAIDGQLAHGREIPEEE